MTKLFCTLLFTLLFITGCGSVTPRDYASDTPKLDVAQYFNGRVNGWGMIQDRSGKVLRRFNVEIDCSWQGNLGVLDETFHWSDGKIEKRVWRIKKEGDKYVGTAGDVVGDAAGEASGNALRWQYVLAVPVDGSTWNMTMDDWMYMIDDTTISNRTRMSKFGFTVAELTIFFRKK